jgi:hypothetical protein
VHSCSSKASFQRSNHKLDDVVSCGMVVALENGPKTGRAAAEYSGRVGLQLLIATSHTSTSWFILY